MVWRAVNVSFTDTLPDFRRKSNFAQAGIQFIFGQLYVNMQGTPVEVQTLKKPDRPQHDRPAASVIAQQYFSQRESNKIQQCIKILFHIYMKLNMFRATHRPSSEA